MYQIEVLLHNLGRLWSLRASLPPLASMREIQAELVALRAQSLDKTERPHTDEASTANVPPARRPEGAGKRSKWKEKDQSRAQAELDDGRAPRLDGCAGPLPHAAGSSKCPPWRSRRNPEASAVKNDIPHVVRFESPMSPRELPSPTVTPSPTSVYHTPTEEIESEAEPAAHADAATTAAPPAAPAALNLSAAPLAEEEIESRVERKVAAALAAMEARMGRAIANALEEKDATVATARAELEQEVARQVDREVEKRLEEADKKVKKAGAREARCAVARRRLTAQPVKRMPSHAVTFCIVPLCCLRVPYA